MIREMSEETWMALLQTARRTASYSYDSETRKAQAVLDECCDEDDHHDFIKEISELAPETFNIHERLRLSFLHLCLLDPEQSPSDVTLPEPLLSVSPSLKSTSKLKLKKEKRIRFNLPSDGDKKDQDHQHDHLKNPISVRHSQTPSVTLKKNCRYYVCGEVLDTKDFSTLKNPKWLNDNF
ncbi:uncharacterized protein [Argopecten irradians]|uniref:uncharacterized protein isoform X1 n=1 Tax=Argopecten irradians TaxID=31199 RepID=UPI00371911F1